MVSVAPSRSLSSSKVGAGEEMKVQRKEQLNNKVQTKEQLMKKKKVQLQPKEELNMKKKIQPQMQLVTKTVQPKEELNDKKIQPQKQLVTKTVQPKEQLNDKKIQPQKQLVQPKMEKENRLTRVLRSIGSVDVQIIFDDMFIPGFQAVVISHGAIEAKASVPTAGIPMEDIVGGIMDVASSFNQKICPTLVHQDAAEQEVIDKHVTTMVEQQLALECENSKLPLKSKQSLFRNATFAVSMAVCKLAASHKELPFFRYIANLAGNKDVLFPVPAYNVMKAHSHPTNKLAVQDYILIPVGATSSRDAQDMDMRLLTCLKDLYSTRYGQDATMKNGCDCFFANKIKDMKEGLELLNTAIDNLGLTGKVVIGVDVAASVSVSSSDEVYAPHKGDEKNDNERDEFKKMFMNLQSFVRDYHVESIKDPFCLDDLELYSKLTAEVGHGQQVEIIGDGLVQLSNLTSLKSAIEKRTCNALLLKMNEIGSVTECISAVEMAKQAGWSCILATFGCGSGDTKETSYADLSVGLVVDQVRFGTITGQRFEIYTRFDEIQQQLCGNDEINVPYTGKTKKRKLGALVRV